MDIRNHPQESELVRRWSAGDESAFRELYQHYRLPLFGYINKRLHFQNLERAEEIFQDTWLKATRNIGQYDDKSKLLAWLCWIAHNTLVDSFRKNPIADTEALNESLEYEARELPADEQLIQTERLSALREAIQRLVPEQRRVVKYRCEGLTFREMAEREKQSINTILARMQYALKHLRRMMEPFKEER